MARKPKRPGKGVYGAPKLPVASSYVIPRRPLALLGLGLVVGAVFLAYSMVDRFSGGTFLSGGPLSSGHAVLERDCAACHGGFEAPTNDACSTCHEKFGDPLGTYSFDAHYLYRSNDFQQVVASVNEMTCAECHTEHQGRTANLTAVVDARCLTCHQQGSFVDGHPEFAFAEVPDGDDDALNFGHGFHVKEVMEDRGWADVEQACLVCHQPEPDGRTFGPINFDRHCESCHLTAGTATPRLAVAEGEDLEAGGLGVETLEMIRADLGPGIDWAFYTDPTEFRQAGRSVAKTTIYHEDPWILHNLRRLRGLLYDDAGLADLLVTSPDVAASDQRRLYEEAISTLEDQIRGLRGTPDSGLQDQLRDLEGLLVRARRVLADPFAPLDETELLLALSEPKDLPEEILSEAQLLIGDLTEPCTGCHWVENATVVRVNGDQRTLHKAEFDHGAHIIQRRCLDCHQQIPILDVVSGGDPDPAVDHAGIHNLPTIATCRECHTPRSVTSSCVTCHLFHPDAERRADFLRYVGPEDLEGLSALQPSSGKREGADSLENSESAGTGTAEPIELNAETQAVEPDLGEE